MSNQATTLRRHIREEMRREKISVDKHLKGVEDAIKLAEIAYTVGDKDAVPAIKLKMDGHLALLRKRLPDLKSIELTGESSLPVLVLKDLGGRMPHEVPQLRDGADAIIEGELNVEVPDAFADIFE